MEKNMEKTTQSGRSGWKPEETEMLWQEIRQAAESGAPLRGVFERMGQTLGRKPNSVRNYYYMQLRDQAGKEYRRAAPFETFSDEDIHQLLRRVLMARGQGKSVRACVMELSGGDRTLMLRYQNKYRSLLRKKPEMLKLVCQELRREGLPCPGDDALARPAQPRFSLEPQTSQDPDVRAILSALSSLAHRAGEAAEAPGPESDRLRVERDLLLMQVEDLQSAAKALICDCKDFLGRSLEDRASHLPPFCEALAARVAQLERVSG